jgi:predicted ATPase
MDNDNDWINFNVPMRIEKLVGHIIDSLDCREIVLLKYASTIGNIFDIDKLSKLSPFNTLTFDDLYTILQRLEVNNIIK